MDATATRDLAKLADRFNANGSDSVASDRDVSAAMVEMGRRARAAARQLGLARTADKDAALRAMAASIRGSAETILAANADDVDEAMQHIYHYITTNYKVLPRKPFWWLFERR